MIKGKTKIILTDVNTGKQEVHEDANMVTNALKYLMGAEIGCGQNPNNAILPVATNALGGLMLFDGNLTEDADNIHFPSEAHLVGYAARGTNTSDKMSGSMNSAETGRSETGYTTTWDFGTSQANGTIKAVALTSSYGGNCPIKYRNYSYMNKRYAIKSTEWSNWYPIRYDGSYIYMLKLTDDGTNAEIRKQYFPCNKFKVNDRSDRGYATAENVTSFSTDYVTLTLTNGYAENDKDNYYEEERTLYARNTFQYIDGLDGYIYCFSGGAENSKNKTDNLVYYFTLNYGDGSWKKSETKSFSISAGFSYIYAQRYTHVIHPTRYAQKGSYAQKYWDHSLYAFAAGKLYLRNNKHIIIIPLSNPLSQNAITVFSDKVNDQIDSFVADLFQNGGALFRTHQYYESGGEYYRYGIIYPDGLYIITEQNANNYDASFQRVSNNCFLPSSDGTLGRVTFYYADSSYFYAGVERNYLGTINNLSSPITKTASQTMKVIYTLTDVDDEESSAT